MERVGTTSARWRTSARLMLAIGMISIFLLPVAGASAQVPSAGRGGNGGVTLQGGLTYDLVYESLPTAGESSVTPAYSGITGLDVAGDGTVFFAEHHGGIQTLDPDSGIATYLGRVNAATHKCATCEETNLWESGLHGFALANDFDETGHLYISYTVANSTCEIPSNIQGETNPGCWHLSRFTYDDSGLTPTIDFSDETVLLDWPFSRFGLTGPSGRTAAHQSGGITVLPDDTIVIAVGDNTSHASHSGYGPRDPRPANWFFNGERTSLNPADRRGKLLRVNPDGTVPADNPFIGKVGTYRFSETPVAYDPYILAEGMRNPYRLAADPKTGTVYSGQVGPDASVSDPNRGPAGEEELNVIGRADCDTPTATGECAYHAFNGGYPRCIGPGRPYIQFDYINNRSLNVPEDCSSFDLPALWYPKTQEDDEIWPQLRGSGSTIVPLEVYNSDAPGALDVLQDDLLMFEWSRGWMATIPVTDSGELDVATENVEIMGRGFKGAIDAAVAPDGSVYVAEFGGYFSFTSRIGRISAAGADPVPSAITDAASTSALATVFPVAALIPALLLGLVAVVRRRRLV